MEASLQRELARAAARGDTEAVLALVYGGHADLNVAAAPGSSASVYDNQTPLALAAARGQCETVLAAVRECGIDCNVPDGAGETPVLPAGLSEFNGHPEH